MGQGHEPRSLRPRLIDVPGFGDQFMSNRSPHHHSTHHASRAANSRGVSAPESRANARDREELPGARQSSVAVASLAVSEEALCCCGKGRENSESGRGQHDVPNAVRYRARKPPARPAATWPQDYGPHAGSARGSRADTFCHGPRSSSPSACRFDHRLDKQGDVIITFHLPHDNYRLLH